MKRETEPRMLQIATAAACMVSLSMGLISVLRGAVVLRGMEPPFPIDLDSHYRYLSGLLLGIGIAFIATIPRIESSGTVFRTLGFVILVGGLSRLLSLIQNGPPGLGHQFGLVMELIVVPCLVLWQARVAKRYAG